MKGQARKGLSHFKNTHCQDKEHLGIKAAAQKGADWNHDPINH